MRYTGIFSTVWCKWHFWQESSVSLTDTNNNVYCCRLPLSMYFLFKCHCNQLTSDTVAMKVSWLTAVTSNWPRLFVNCTLNGTGYFCFYSCWTLFLLFTLSYFQLHFNELMRRYYVFQILCKTQRWSYCLYNDHMIWYGYGLLNDH